jgi:ABC-type cobalt transport system substrate-binding protein
MNIRDILLIIIIIYLILSHSKKNKNIENFALSVDDKNEVINLIKNEIRPVVKEIYNTDMSAVRNLDKLAQDIQSGGYSIDGNLTTTKNLTVSGAFNLLPRGTIVAFNSTSAPSGWTLCDGSNGSPDLRGKFIRMWNNNTGGFNSDGAKKYTTSVNSTYNVAWPGHYRDDQEGYILQHSFGSYAGSDLHHQHVNEIASHTHTGSTSTDGNHSHNYLNSGLWGGGNREVRNGSSYGWNAHWGGTEDAGNHYHTFTTNGAGAGWGFSSQPPYYVLTWIMKL